LIRFNSTQRRRYNNAFKFENSWLLEPELNEVVRKGWDKNPDVDLTSKFKNCYKEMKKISGDNTEIKLMIVEDI